MVPNDRPEDSTQHMSVSNIFSHMLTPQPKKYRQTDMVIFPICPGVTFQSNKIKNFISLTLQVIINKVWPKMAFVP